MIKKNTKMIFRGLDTEAPEELIGGIPLAVGESIGVMKNGQSSEFTVTEKKVDLVFEGEDQIANITYILARN